jgi:hypothetical protein
MHRRCKSTRRHDYARYGGHREGLYEHLALLQNGLLVRVEGSPELEKVIGEHFKTGAGK